MARTSVKLSTQLVYGCILSLAAFNALFSCCTAFPTFYKLHSQAQELPPYSYIPVGAGGGGGPYVPTTDDDYNNFRINDANNNYNPYTYSLDGSDNDNSNWNIAQDPASPYELPEDYYVGTETDPETQWAELETLTNLLDMYDALNTAGEQEQQEEKPTWGRVVNEEPAAELELEELKHKKKIPQPSVKFEEPKATGSSPKTTTTTTPITPKAGMKEIPLLRPPVAAGSTSTSSAINQRSDKSAAGAPSGKKPSPYDTLRKYLTLEDALKKEAEKRRHEIHANAPNTGSRQKKSGGGIVADAESLTRQLNNLKKSVT